MWPGCASSDDTTFGSPDDGIEWKRQRQRQRRCTHQPHRHQEDLLHRRPRDARAGRRALRDPEGRIRRHQWPVRLWQDHAALDPGIARLSDAWRVHARRRERRIAGAVGAGTRPQPADRVHLPGVQPHRRPQRVRQRGAPADLSRHARCRAKGSCRGGAGPRRDVAPRQALSRAVEWRPAAARGGRARRRR